MKSFYFRFTDFSLFNRPTCIDIFLVIIKYVTRKKSGWVIELITFGQTLWHHHPAAFQPTLAFSQSMTMSHTGKIENPICTLGNGSGADGRCVNPELSSNRLQT